MGFLNLFRRKPEPDYETVLSALEARIKMREDHLLSIRLRERRANALFITYGIGAWLIYSVVWYSILRYRADGIDKLLRVLPVIASPVGIVFTKKFMRWFFGRQQEKEIKALKVLKKEQQDKVEELKRKTGYYSTRSLLEKYDEGTKNTVGVSCWFIRSVLNWSGSSSFSDNLTSQPNRTPAGSQPSTPARGNFPPSGPVHTPGSNAATPNRSMNPPMPPTIPGPAGSAPQLPLLPPALSSPAPRTLLDKLADALIGANQEDVSPHSKYALICANCYSHNGLVVKEEWDTIQYRCPRCGFFNPRRKKEGGEGDNAEGKGSLGHRRRVKSVHVTHTRRHDSDSDVRRSSATATSGSTVAEEPSASVETVTSEVKSGDEAVMGIGPESESGETMMREKSGGSLTSARKRGAGARSKRMQEDEDAMDTDP
ncbi:BQ5605_C001g00882 [Microbotryum silenes-dioicae]|uniref:Endoplasmic reticulum junction formation protein lunapark n=1 Tax=Microbotryum silenes-dioicae TaxID=796604 RepID=A0A2X0MS14_9BASI|nr:BQ5605_C001g00882 [Microbotryum silenes-dioicae]